jgi:multiple sugar transport system ATP-binding protein
MTAVHISKLCKQFGDTVVLRGVSIEVPEGAFAVLVGPSGCGKSTLLRCIAGLEQADGGSIVFGDRDVTKLEPRERDVAMVFQSYALYPHLTVGDNLAFGLRLRGTDEEAIAKRVSEVSNMLGIAELLDRMPKALSGGQRQRVAMGRAIARRPALFLFDEPLSNLDAALRAQVRVDIRKLHDELATTSVYVTHDQVEAMTLADVIFVLNDGRVEQRGAPLDVYERPATRFVAGFLGSPAMNFLDATVDGGALRMGDVVLNVEGHTLEDGANVSLGIRPHDLEPDEAGPLVVEVTYTEQLGGETYAYGELAGQVVVVRLDPHARVAAGEQLALAVAPERVHLFGEDGKSLRC